MGRDSLEQLFDRYVREGDENAIAELVRRSRPRLLSAARRISARDADDCVQSAFLSLLHKRQEGVDAPILPWLITAVVRIAYRHKAQHKRQRALAQHLSRSRREASSDAELAKGLRTRVDRLPAPYRDAVVLHYIEGVSTEHASRLLEISRDAFKKRLQRARAFLRSTWNPRTLRLLLAVPWFLADTAAAAAVGGGVLMTKKAAVAAVLVLMAAGTATVVVKRTERAPSPRSDDTAQRRVEPAHDSTTPAPGSTAPETRSADEVRKAGYFGVVVDTAGTPIGDALVELRKLFVRGQKNAFHRDRQPVAHTLVRTSSNGRFQLDARWKQESVIAAELHVVAEGHPRTIARVNRDVASRIVLGPGGKLSVVVRDEEGVFVTGAAALLCEPERIVTFPPSPPPVVVSGKTDARGSVAYHVSPGRYRLVVHSEGFTPIDTAPFAIESNGNRTLQLVLKRGTLVAFHVVDEDGRDIKDAQVEVRGLHRSGGTASTDDRGRCQIGGIAPPPADGDYWKSRMYWHVEAKGFAATEGSRTLPTEPGREHVRIVLRRGVPVALRIVDRSGKALMKAGVTGSYDRNMANPIKRTFHAYSGPGGRVTLPRMNPGKRVLGVYLHGFMRKTVELEIGSEPIETEVTLVKAGSSIRGVVLRPDGEKAKGGRIGFALDDAKTRALGMICVFEIGADGSFEIKRAATGVGRVFTIADGFGAQSWPLTMDEGSDREGLTLRLLELASVTGKVTDRDGTPLPGIRVRLTQRLETVSGAITSHDTAETRSLPDGTFRLRGLADGEYRLRARSKEWIPVNALGLVVKPGARDLLVKMKPRSEGSGIKLVVLLPTPVDKIVGYHRVKGMPHWMQIVKTTAKAVEFRIHNGPGLYDFTFEAPGHRPFEIKGVRIADGPDNPPLEVRFDRGAILRLRVVDADGKPLPNQTVSYRNQVVRTDENGECEFGGFEPGPHDIHVLLVSDRFTYARVPGVRVPGRATIRLLRHAHIHVKHTVTYGELEKGARWKLLDAAGNVVDERVFDMARIGHGYASDRKVSGYLRTTRAGRYRVVAVIDGRQAEQVLDIPLGKQTTLELDP